MKVFVELFYLTVPKNFAEGTFFPVVHKFPLAKNLCIRGGWRGEYQDFPSKKICLTVPKKFAGNPIGFLYFRVSEVFMLQRVMSRFSVENISPHSAEKLRRETFLASVSENTR